MRPNYIVVETSFVNCAVNMIEREMFIWFLSSVVVFCVKNLIA